MNQKNGLYGMAFQCPYKNRNPGCIFYYMEHLTFREKIAWIDQISPQLADNILIVHTNCRKNLNENHHK